MAVLNIGKWLFESHREHFTVECEEVLELLLVVFQRNLLDIQIRVSGLLTLGPLPNLRIFGEFFVLVVIWHDYEAVGVSLHLLFVPSFDDLLSSIRRVKINESDPFRLQGLSIKYNLASQQEVLLHIWLLFGLDALFLKHFLIPFLEFLSVNQIVFENEIQLLDHFYLGTTWIE